MRAPLLPDPARIEATCIECGRPATGVAESTLDGMTARAYYCATGNHELCARRALGLQDAP